MFRLFSKIIYNFLKLIDNFLKFLFKRSFLLWFKEFIENDSYKKINFPQENKQIKLFAPNYLTNWLYDEFFSKEPETINWIDNFKENKNGEIIFWDIGSNLGLYSIYAAIKHKNIKVISFEPSTSNLRILSRNISINNLQEKIYIFQLALSDKSFNFSKFKERKFGEGESNNSFSYFDFEGETFKEENSYNIFGTSINDLIENKILEIPDYIKIDVDGLEHLILKGSEKCLRNERLKALQVEVNENFLEQNENIKKIMKKNNFKFIEKKRNENLMIYKNSKFSKTYNYFFYRQEI